MWALTPPHPAPVGNIPWQDDLAMGFHYKMFKLWNNGEGKKAELPRIGMSSSSRARVPNPGRCPKGSAVPHAGMPAPSPQQRRRMEDQAASLLPGSKPPAKFGSGGRIPGETKAMRAVKAGRARAESCTPTNRSRPRQPPQNLTLHLSRRSCQNEAVALTASSEPR